MSIRIVKRDERLTFESDESKIFYRRITERERNEIRERNSDGPEFDSEGFTRDVLKLCVVGWEGILDGDQPAAFTIENVEALPTTVLGPLVAAIYGEAPRKN
jgi:hypothetical protein